MVGNFDFHLRAYHPFDVPIVADRQTGRAYRRSNDVVARIPPQARDLRESLRKEGWEHFGEVAVDISAAGLLFPPTSVDDCDSFSSVVPYGFAGESANSNVGDWGGEAAIDIPRCGKVEITKIATPAADSSFEFDWELSDNAS